MNKLIKLGKRRTILITISILLVSALTIYFYQAVVPETGIKKLVQQIIRFILTLSLLIFTYKGKKWAQIISVILFSLGILGAVIGLVTLKVPFVNKIPFLVMLFIYSMAVYHFGFSRSYKAFFEYQNRDSAKQEQMDEDVRSDF